MGLQGKEGVAGQVGEMYTQLGVQSKWALQHWNLLSSLQQPQASACWGVPAPFPPHSPPTAQLPYSHASRQAHSPATAGKGGQGGQGGQVSGCGAGADASPGAGASAGAGANAGAVAMSSAAAG